MGDNQIRDEGKKRRQKAQEDKRAEALRANLQRRKAAKKPVDD